MHPENPAHHVLVDIDTEGQPDLLCNSRAAPRGVAPFHFNDGIDQFFFRAFRTRPTPGMGRKQLAILSFDEQVMEMEQSGGPQNKSRTAERVRDASEECTTLQSSDPKPEDWEHASGRLRISVDAERAWIRMERNANHPASLVELWSRLHEEKGQKYHSCRDGIKLENPCSLRQL